MDTFSETTIGVRDPVGTAHWLLFETATSNNNQSTFKSFWRMSPQYHSMSNNRKDIPAKAQRIANFLHSGWHGLGFGIGARANMTQLNTDTRSIARRWITLAVLATHWRIISMTRALGKTLIHDGGGELFCNSRKFGKIGLELLLGYNPFEGQVDGTGFHVVFGHCASFGARIKLRQGREVHASFLLKKNKKKNKTNPIKTNPRRR
jgi:hypothetical protein